MSIPKVHLLINNIAHTGSWDARIRQVQILCHALRSDRPVKTLLDESFASESRDVGGGRGESVPHARVQRAWKDVVQTSVGLVGNGGDGVLEADFLSNEAGRSDGETRCDVSNRERGYIVANAGVLEDVAHGLVDITTAQVIEAPVSFHSGECGVVRVKSIVPRLTKDEFYA